MNSHGRICHSILERNYLVDTKMKDIFDCIFGLLLTPEVYIFIYIEIMLNLIKFQ